MPTTLPTATDLADLTAAELIEFTSAYQREGQRRSVLLNTPDQVDQAARGYRDAGGDLNALITRIKSIRDEA